MVSANPTRLFAPIALLAGIILTGCAEPTPGDRAYFSDLDRLLIAGGKLKVDRLARDVPVTSAQLAEHFRHVAFGEEFVLRDGQPSAPPSPLSGKLRRWEAAIPYRLTGRVSAEDNSTIASFANKLSALTGRTIAAADAAAPSLDIQILGAPERAALARDFLGKRSNSPMAELFLAWAQAPRWPCASEIYYRGPGHPDAFAISFAVIYIRDEVDGLSRQACIEEEMAQVLGLARDDPRVRPSIFNDDEEYALLTEHDARLIRILYDPRLAPGMSQAESMPIVRAIAAELAAGP